MNTPTTISARKTALFVLNRLDIAGHDAKNLLNKNLARTDRRAQATDIVYGVLRNRPLLDNILTVTTDIPSGRINKKVVNILRIAAYELVFAPLTAQYAVVDEAVKLTHSTAGKRTAGFVNAVLRKLTSKISERTTPIKPEYCRRIIPQSEQTGCLFDFDILPDFQKEPSEYLSTAFSLPCWLIENWLKEFGVESSYRICIASNRRPSVFLSPNLLKNSAQTLAEMLRVSGIDYEPMPDNRMLKINGGISVTDIQGFTDGLFTVQDPTAAEVVLSLAPQPGQTVIDMCAAPGTKTMQLAWLMNNTGRIIACDINTDRLKMIDENCRRLGISIVKTVKPENLAAVIAETGPVDAVLLDVPCSNTGVLARRPEVRLRIQLSVVTELKKTQLKLLQRAVSLVKHGGKICYSTCSILRQENSDVAEEFLMINSQFSPAFRRLTLPMYDEHSGCEHDGGFVAIFLKN